MACGLCTLLPTLYADFFFAVIRPEFIAIIIGGNTGLGIGIASVSSTFNTASISSKKAIKLNVHSMRLCRSNFDHLHITEWTYRAISGLRNRHSVPSASGLVILELGEEEALA